MITLDQPNLDAQVARWSGYIIAKAQTLKLGCRGVLKKEAGRLVQTMMNIGPPLDGRHALWERIDKRVWSTFAWMGEDSLERAQLAGHLVTSTPSSGVHWYAWDTSHLWGIAADKDMSSASDKTLYELYFNTNFTAQGMVKSQRGKQEVRIWQKIATNISNVKNLAARLKRHAGRLKAGWLPAWTALGKPTGIYTPPQWVTDHTAGARGSCDVSGLANADSPHIAIRNFAVGVGGRSYKYAVDRALTMRANAMVERMKYLVKYPEKVAEEEAL